MLLRKERKFKRAIIIGNDNTDQTWYRELKRKKERICSKRERYRKRRRKIGAKKERKRKQTGSEKKER